MRQRAQRARLALVFRECGSSPYYPLWSIPRIARRAGSGTCAVHVISSIARIARIVLFIR